MIDDPVLVDEWHVVARSDDVPEEGVAAARHVHQRPPTGQPSGWPWRAFSSGWPWRGRSRASP